jgi:hypothetical protein
MSRIIIFLYAGVLAAVNVTCSTASQLIFQPAAGGFSDSSLLQAGYGDRIAATSQDGFLYSLDGGATPNVVTRYGPSDNLVNIFTWGEQYGDLHNVIYAQEPQPFEFRLVADSGFKVILNSFDMAGWPNLDFPSIASIRVEDGSGNQLFSQSNVVIQGDANGPQHTYFSFAGVSANELRIKFDSTTDGHGNVLDSDDVGLDNINFSQSATAALIGDYNQNGTVDAADYILWRKYNNTAITLPNDSTPGTSPADYAVWRAHFGQTVGSGAGASANAAVPEPAPVVLLIAGLLTFVLADVRRCHKLIGPVEKEHFCGFGFGLIFCGGLGL